VVVLRHAKLLSGELQERVEATRQFLAALAELPMIRRQDTAECNAYASLLQRQPGVWGLAAARPDGSVYCGDLPRPAGAANSDVSFVRGALETGRLTAGTYTATANGEQLIPLALAYRNADGRPGGVLISWLKLNGRFRDSLDARELPPGASVLIADREGIILWRSPDGQGGSHWAGRPVSAVFHGILGEKQPATAEIEGVDGVPRIVGYVPVGAAPDTGLFLSVGLPAERVAAELWTATERALVLNVMILVPGIVGAWLICDRGLRRPLARLVSIARRWRAGDYEARFTCCDGACEFDDLGAALGSMAEALAQRERELQEANRLKSRVLAVAAHDFRQPVQVLSLSLAGLESDADPRNLAHLRRMGAALERLVGQLNELSLAARLDTRGLRPVLQAVALDQLLGETAAPLRPLAERKGLALRIAPSGTVVHSDPAMLRTILENLLGNAIKYTESGYVLIACSNLDKEVALEVHDTGMGIPPERLDMIFNAFYRLEPGRRDGLGLGLSIVQATCQLLGHRITVRSTPGRGSCFSVILPRMHGSRPPPSQTAELEEINA
jgi:signal transduction histidine kinase